MAFVHRKKEEIPMDWMTQLAQYVPQTPQEAADKAALYRNMERLCWNAVPLVAAIFAVRG